MFSQLRIGGLPWRFDSADSQDLDRLTVMHGMDVVDMDPRTNVFSECFFRSVYQSLPVTYLGDAFWKAVTEDGGLACGCMGGFASAALLCVGGVAVARHVCVCKCGRLFYLLLVMMRACWLDFFCSCSCCAFGSLFACRNIFHV